MKNIKIVAAVQCIISKLFFAVVENMDIVNEKPKSAEKMRIFIYDFTIKYFAESEDSKVPVQATPESAGYELSLLI